MSEKTNEKMYAPGDEELAQVTGGSPYDRGLVGGSEGNPSPIAPGSSDRSPSGGDDPCRYEYKLVCEECGREIGRMTAAEKAKYFGMSIPPSRFCDSYLFLSKKLLRAVCSQNRSGASRLDRRERFFDCNLERN